MTLPAVENTVNAPAFVAERNRLLAALRHVTAGGVIEQIAQVGAASMPGLPASSLLEMAITMWPFPLEAPVLTQLADLGYMRVPSAEETGCVRFRHVTGTFSLAIWMAGAEAWFDCIVVRDYLRADADARVCYAHTALAPVAEPALVAAARTWWVQYHGFTPLHAVAEELRTLPAPWYISSGWALDLFLGQPSRCHHDVDVVIARADQLRLQQHLTDRGWQFATPLDGRLEPWPRHMYLELPRHQVHAHRAGAFIDILFTDIAHGVWRYRREPSIVQATERIVLQTADGLSFLAPEVVLLFKSKNTGNQDRSKDQTDFECVYPHLDLTRRAWLRWALCVTTPQHPWLALLT